MQANLNKPLKIYNASAGSGKTYTLVQEYLRIILSVKDAFKFKSILAMTFTNKAANEMKERVLKALIDLKTPYNLKSEGQKKFLEETAANLGIDPEVIMERSATILNKILHNYSSFSVMTIDKFTHKIIRTFARDLGLSIDFDVELDVKGLRKNVTDLLFQKIGRSQELTNLMLKYAHDNLEQDKSWNFSNQLFEFSDQLFKEDAIKSIDLLRNLSGADFEKVKNEIKSENAKIENAIISNAKQALDLIKSKGLTAQDFVEKGRGIVSYFTKVSKGTFDYPSNTIANNVADQKWAHPQSPNQAEVEGIADLLHQYYNQIIGQLDVNLKVFNLNLEIQKNLNNLSLLNHLLKIVEELKEEENILLISDFYQKISDLIIKEPIPFIYEHLGTRYEHFLLDEFQDTSKLQWLNMVPLVHNALASNNLNLIVGDGKQAIYRWRNGEVEQFTQLPNKILNPNGVESLREAEIIFKAQGEKIELNKNFRSAPEVVNFNNALFLDLAQKLNAELTYIYEDVAQQPQKKHPGFVTAHFEDDMDSDDQLDYTFNAIQKALAHGFALKDICVIVRNNDKGSLIANHLSENGIDVISPDSLFIGKDATVKFIFHLLNALIQPKNNNYKYKALEFFAFLTEQKPIELIQASQGISIKAYFEQKGIMVPDNNQFHNLYEFVEALIQVFDFDASFNSFLQFFLEMVHQFETKNNSNLRDFLSWFKDKGAEKSIVSPVGANAVQIMTIHKSKGLQFPVVICPFLDWKFDMSKQVVWVDGNEHKLPAFFVKMTKNIKESVIDEVYTEEEGKFYLDQLNLLYVAFTRPETALFLCGKSNGKASPVKNWLLSFFESSDLFTFKEGDYTFGELKNPKFETEELNPNYALTYLKQVMNKPQLSYKSGSDWDVHDLDQKRNFGTLVHKVLSKLTAKNDLDTVVMDMMSKGLIEEKLANEIKAYVLSLFQDLNFSFYFEQEVKVYNEKEIIDSNGQKLIPDKVLFLKDQVLIVDFKTGQAAESHQKQVKTYIKLYKDLGFEQVSGELYYTENKMVKKVG